MSFLALDPKRSADPALEQPALPPARRLGFRIAGEASQAWMVTFTDLVALMLTFFVMLYAMSQLEEQRWQNLVDSLALNLNSVSARQVTAPQVSLTLDSAKESPGTDLDYLMTLLAAQLPSDPVLGQAILRRQNDRLVLSLPGDLLFDAGSNAPWEQASSAASALAALLLRLGNRIEVAGHADPRPTGADFASNWELSLARAEAFARLLQAGGYDLPILVRGYGDGRFAQLSSALGESQRLSFARRVDVVIHESAGPQ